MAQAPPIFYRGFSYASYDNNGHFACNLTCSGWHVRHSPLKVYEQNLAGEAELARATQNRQIRIQEAKAKQEAATLEAQAEVERAKGVAEANKIIGDSLKGNEAYLRYLWIQGLQEGATPQVVYVPTEAGLPILEAGRTNGKQ